MVCYECCIESVWFGLTVLPNKYSYSKQTISYKLIQISSDSDDYIFISFAIFNTTCNSIQPICTHISTIQWLQIAFANDISNFRSNTVNTRKLSVSHLFQIRSVCVFNSWLAGEKYDTRKLIYTVLLLINPLNRLADASFLWLTNSIITAHSYGIVNWAIIHISKRSKIYIHVCSYI